MASARDTGAGQAFLLSPGSRLRIDGELVIGRDESAGLMLDSSQASRFHARVVALANGSYRIEDLKSKNGTYVNRRLIDGASPLNDGDEIFVGGSTLRFIGSPVQTAVADRPFPAPPAIRVELTAERLGIGRSPANEIVLDDPNVSRFHAEIAKVDGEARIRDLGSRNGTYVEGERVTDRPLAAGTDIRIGPYRLIYDSERIIARDERALLRLDADRISFAVDGKEILAEMSLAILPGELTAIIGESGAGKTTLIRLLAGVTHPSSGTVSLGGEPIAARTTDIAYVPQHEIVHGSLSIDEALAYASRLRLPADTSRTEMEARIDATLRELSLAGHRGTRIAALSGGQRRRVGLGVELLARPSLLCLDEPTTGLDPMLESQAMSLFRELATDARSVVLVTHATQSLHLCDRLVVMARGGRLAFSGASEEALAFFEVKSFNDIYAALASRPATEWSRRYREREQPAGQRPLRGPRAKGAAAGRPRATVGHQAAILFSRYSRTFRRDRRNLLILFGQVPLIAVALVGLFGADVFSRANGTPNDAYLLLFLMVTMSTWFGLFDAARELIKERGVFLRERAVGVRVSAYLLSKVGLLFAVSSLQIGMLCVLVLATTPLHEGTAVYVGLTACLLTTGFAAVCMGLLMSALVGSEDQAASFVLLLLVPQLLFAGAFIPLAKMSALVADLTNLVFAKWSYALAGTLLEMNERIALDPEAAKTNSYGSDFFAASLPLTYSVLAGFGLIFASLAGILLARRAS